MGKEQDGERPVYQVLEPRTIALISVIVVAVGVGLAIWLVRAYGQGNPGDNTRLDAIKTAGGIVIGSGGAVALWLAARRQRTTEIALKQKDRDQDHAEQDAAERRVTELYTKAADQLGSDKAPVRLAGMYALERLAQNTPDQRQTIVNLLCAYLRMPYLPGQPLAQHSPARPAEPASVQDPASSGEPAAPEAVTAQPEQDDQREQERQVRLTAQRILTSHLRPGDPAQPAATFWADIDLDLTGATLLDFNFAGCHLRTAHFAQARFNGRAEFDGAQFSGTAWFGRAQFSGTAWFGRAQFSERAGFGRARFSRTAEFGWAQFSWGAGFGKAQFSTNAEFGAAQFSGSTWFGKAQFSGTAEFGEAQFSSDARFDAAQFSGDAVFGADAVFGGAQFSGIAVFDGARFSGDAEFGGAQFSGSTWFDKAQFSGTANFDRAQFSGTAGFDEAQFSGDTVFENVRVLMDVSDGVARTWPPGYSLTAPATPEEGKLEGNNGSWGYLIHADSPPPEQSAESQPTQ